MKHSWFRSDNPTFSNLMTLLKLRKYSGELLKSCGNYSNWKAINVQHCEVFSHVVGFVTRVLKPHTTRSRRFLGRSSACTNTQKLTETCREIHFLLNFFLPSLFKYSSTWMCRSRTHNQWQILSKTSLHHVCFTFGSFDQRYFPSS